MLSWFKNKFERRPPRFRRFAHHPHCDFHEHHLIWLANHPLCLGCVGMFSGVVLALPFVYALDWSAYEPMQIFLLSALFVAPTAPQPWLQRKAYKLFARTCLGFGSTIYLLPLSSYHPIVSEKPSIQIGLIGIFFVVLWALGYVRNRFKDDPCRSCELGTYPTCSWNRPNLVNFNRSK